MMKQPNERGTVKPAGKASRDLAKIGRRITQKRMQAQMSQESLADALGLSRQFISAIESGKSLPSLPVAIQLARLLNTTVEALFGELNPIDEPAVIPVSSFSPGDRLQVARIDRRLVAFPLSKEKGFYPADARVSDATGTLEWIETGAESRETLVMAGCDPALSLLGRWISENTPLRLITLSKGSEAALESLFRNEAHIAGIHGALQGGGHLRHLSVQEAAEARFASVHFARWEIGIAVARGNAKHVRNLEDLHRPDLRWVKREKGSVVHRMYADALQKTACPENRVNWVAQEAQSHLDVAQMIRMNLADAGLTTAACAHLYQLDFIPVEEHRFDLLIPADKMRRPLVMQLLDHMETRRFRRQLETLWGYNVHELGEVTGPIPL